MGDGRLEGYQGYPDNVCTIFVYGLGILSDFFSTEGFATSAQRDSSVQLWNLNMTELANAEGDGEPRAVYYKNR